MNQKKCTDCKELKLESEFYQDRSKKSGAKSYCKKCGSKRSIKFKKAKGKDYEKNTRLKTTYGISLADYNNMFLEQSGECYICKTHQSFFKRALAVDHCHRTGKVRGLLCHKCNAALGLVDDNQDLLKSMINYLELHSSSSCPL